MVSGSSPSDGGSESDVGSAPPVTYTDLFYEHLPFYLSIGMTYDQYWNDDCCLVKYYRKAYDIAKERRNQELWLQGMYVYEALCDVSPIMRAFSKKGTMPIEYSKEPYAITVKELDRRKVEKERLSYEKMKAKTNAFAIKFNANYNRKE